MTQSVLNAFGEQIRKNAPSRLRDFVIAHADEIGALLLESALGDLASEFRITPESESPSASESRARTRTGKAGPSAKAAANRSADGKAGGRKRQLGRNPETTATDEKIMAFLRSRGKEGANKAEIHKATGIDSLYITARCWRLRQKGKVRTVGNTSKSRYVAIA